MKHTAIRNSLVLACFAAAAALLPCLVAAGIREEQDWLFQKRQQQRGRRQLQEFPDELLVEHKEVQPSDDNTMFLSEKLKNDLLENYDRGSFPWEQVWEQSSTKTLSGDLIVKGLDVEMGLNFHKIFEVDVTKSVVDFVVWVRMQWKDPRLVWNPTDYGNVTEAFFWIGDGSGSGGETSEIWSPDIQLWNLETELTETLVDIHAKVQSDGTVFWSRPGRLRPVCKFDGLNNFPFDTLKCTMEFGSWAYSGKYLRPTKYGDDGYSIGGSDTAGEAFAEFSLANVEVEEKIYPPYPAAPSEDWPVLMYHIQFKRAWKPYMRGYLAVQILLNIVGFGAFWLPVTCGERMGLAITAVLAAVASDLVVSSQLPNSNELTWINKFMVGSAAFAFGVVFQCTVVIYFFYYTGDNLQPTWFKWFRQATPKTMPVERDSTTKVTSPMTPGQIEDHQEESIVFCNSDREDEEESQESQLDKRDGSRISFVTEVGSSRRDSFDLFRSRKDQEDEDEEESQLNKRDRSRSSFVTEGGSSRFDLFRSKKASRMLLKARDANDFKNKDEAENNRNWQTLASHIDEGSKVIFPSAFVVFLAVMFGTIN